MSSCNISRRGEGAADGTGPPRDLLANNAFTTTIGAGRHKQQTSQAVVGPFVGPGDLGGPGGPGRPGGPWDPLPLYA